MSDTFSFEFDAKSLARTKKTLDKYRDRGLQERMKRGTLQAARMLVPSIRGAAPVRTGVLSRSVRASQGRGTMSAIVGPTDRKRHLVIQPHRIVTPGGRDTGSQTTGNPFVDAATEPRVDEAVRVVSEILFAK